MTSSAARILAALVSGAVFGLGLSVSGMIDPARVRGFLDLAGTWDPTLLFVMAGAVPTAFLGVRMAGRLKRPVFDTRFALPTSRAIDRRLVVGSALFGVGWGMAGLCPGPALASLSTGLVPAFIFVAAMLAGMLLHDKSAALRHRPNDGQSF